MKHEPDFFHKLRAEFSSLRLWLDRLIVLGYALAAGLSVVAFTLGAKEAFEVFGELHSAQPWAALVWTPALTATIVWATRRWFFGASGSGIPQIKAALDPAMSPEQRAQFASLRLAGAKICLVVLGIGAGLSIGREGPSVQAAAGIMQHARRWLSSGSTVDTRALLIAGGAAGIAATFNAPLAGVMFAIEQLSGRLETRVTGVIISSIVLAGLVAQSVFGNLSYLGIIHVPPLSWGLVGPGLLVVLLSGLAGGLFARLMIASLTDSRERLNRLRTRWPVRFAAVCGLVVAAINLSTGGATIDAGSETVNRMLVSDNEFGPIHALLKFIATWLTAWCGVPGGIFAPSLSIGAGIGDGLSQFAGPSSRPALIAIGMAAFLGAVTQAPLTAFIIVMEMIDGHSMVLSLMASAMLASLVSRMISRPLYDTLASNLVGLTATSSKHR